jgi:3-phenylpropionate/trans-cinnamate dioxygenase ferredoxin subunit
MPHSVRVASVDELRPDSMKTFLVEGTAVLLANVGGSFHAIGAICNHRQWDLSEGTLEEDEVTCAGHGSVWNLRTGEGRFARPLPPEPVYKVEVRGNELFVELP